MDIHTDDLIAFLDRAWTNAATAANSLPEQLSNEQQAALNYIAPVGSIMSVSKNSTSQSSGGYNPGNLTLRQVVSIWTKLIELYASVKGKIVDAALDVVTIPDDYDFDIAVYPLMKQVITSAGRVVAIPDLCDLRASLTHTETTEFISFP